MTSKIFSRDVKDPHKESVQKVNRGLSKPTIRDFSSFMGPNNHRHLLDMIDETIFIVGITPDVSKNFGVGYQLDFVMNPDDDHVLTANIYGIYVVPMLDKLYNASDQGRNINKKHPVKTTIRKVGKSYKFE